MNLLYPKAWREKEKDCLAYYNRYLAIAGLKSKMALELCVSDAAEYIVGRDISELEESDPRTALIIIGALNIWSDMFTIWTTIMVASTFKDYKTASELEGKVQTVEAKLEMRGQDKT